MVSIDSGIFDDKATSKAKTVQGLYSQVIS